MRTGTHDAEVERAEGKEKDKKAGSLLGQEEEKRDMMLIF